MARSNHPNIGLPHSGLPPAPRLRQTNPNLRRRTVRRTGTWTLLIGSLVAGFIVLGGCRRDAAARADSPKAAAKAYLQAMVAGDAAGIRAASVGDEPTARLLTAQAVKTAATERYVAAAAKRYGQAAVADALVGRRAEDHEASVLARIDAEPEAITGDTAVVGQGRVKLFLIKADGQWKVDRGKQLGAVLGDGEQAAAMAEAIRRAYDAVTAEVEAGKHPTPTDAKAALLIRTEREMRPLMTPATATAPATKPAM
jgi:hypothetical protein